MTQANESASSGTQGKTAGPNGGVSRGRKQMLLIMLVCAAPLVLGTIAFYLMPPAGRTNYGHLLTPAPFALQARMDDGSALNVATYDRRWWLVSVDETTCEDDCRAKLLLMRQMKLAQGAKQSRIERLWIVSSASAPSAPEGVTAGVRVAHAASTAQLREAFGGEDPSRHLYLIDPLGNLMMSFPWPPEEKRMLRDIEKLLRINTWSKE